MAGIYVHIPFCNRKCHYCNFYSFASRKYHKEFMDGLLEEIFLRKNYLNEKRIETIYFGGGTPSFVTTDSILTILGEIRKYFPVSAAAEITLEANPEDINANNLLEFRKAGFNRLSIGAQSFFEEDLNYLNRIHSAERARESIREALDSGFSNLSIDLIYGIPTLSAESWKEELDYVLQLEIPHISAYSLTVEPKTALDVLIRKNKLKAPAEDLSIEHFRILQTKMKEAGYVHYEISNFCKPGNFSRHNCQYWNGTPYLGLGPSAHSYNGHSRQWNVANILQYYDQIIRKERFYETEELSLTQKYNEFVMVRLRTMWGCDIRKIRDKFGERVASEFLLLSKPFLQDGKMKEENSAYLLTDEGKLFADGIASSLFILNELQG